MNLKIALLLTLAPAAQATESSFSFSIDGQRYEIAADDVSTSIQIDGALRIMAGPWDGRGVVLTIPDIANCPCTVPAGSTQAGDVLGQGAVSLQNHPDRGITLNSWYLGQTGTPAPAAITVTSIGTPANGERIIEGTFAVPVLATESNGDVPGNRDLEIVDGHFRVVHALIGDDTF